MLELAVWDPEIARDNRIIDDDGEQPSIETLHELYEALIFYIYTTANTHEPNEVQFDTTQFPSPVIDPDQRTVVEKYID